MTSTSTRPGVAGSVHGKFAFVKAKSIKPQSAAFLIFPEHGSDRADRLRAKDKMVRRYIGLVMVKDQGTFLSTNLSFATAREAKAATAEVLWKALKHRAEVDKKLAANIEAIGVELDRVKQGVYPRGDVELEEVVLRYLNRKCACIQGKVDSI